MGPLYRASALLDAFLQGYCGPAGSAIREYIDAVQDSAEATGAVLDGHTRCACLAGSFLAPAMLAQYDTLFDEAEKIVIGNPDLLLRAQRARRPLLHAALQLGYGDVEVRLALAQTLRDYAVRSHTEFFGDFNSRPTQQYRAQL